MLLSDKQLKSLIVETRSGQLLGRIVRFNLDNVSQRVVSYEVCSHSFKGLLHAPEYHISAEQVLEITNIKMIVEDAVVTELVRERRKKTAIPSLVAQEPIKSKISAANIKN